MEIKRGMTFLDKDFDGRPIFVTVHEVGKTYIRGVSKVVGSATQWNFEEWMDGDDEEFYAIFDAFEEKQLIENADEMDTLEWLYGN